MGYAIIDHVLIINHVNLWRWTSEHATCAPGWLSGHVWTTQLHLEVRNAMKMHQTEENNT